MVKTANRPIYYMFEIKYDLKEIAMVLALQTHKIFSFTQGYTKHQKNLEETLRPRSNKIKKIILDVNGGFVVRGI